MGIDTRSVFLLVVATWWACRIAKRTDLAVRGQAYVMEVWDGGWTMQGREHSPGATRALLGVDLFVAAMAVALVERWLPLGPTKVALAVALLVMAVAERALAASPKAPDFASLAEPTVDLDTLDRALAQLHSRRWHLPAAMALRAAAGAGPLAVALSMPGTATAATLTPLATMAGLAAGGVAMLALGGTLVPIARIMQAVDRRAEAPSPLAI